MGATYKTAFPACGPAVWASDGLPAYRGGTSGPSYDADALAYITSAGALFPDDLNTLVLGIKAAGLWDDHLGSIKFAVGVPDFASSLIDLRNPAFNGSASTAPTHSATQGWGFTKASSQYIDSGWKVGATDSKASQDSVHLGLRLMAATVDGGSALMKVFANPNGLGFGYLFDGYVRWAANDTDSSVLSTSTATVTPGAMIGTRTGASARAVYRNGVSLANDTLASGGTLNLNTLIGCRNNAGTPDLFSTARITAFHAGAGLDDTQAATLTALFDTYAAACGEA